MSLFPCVENVSDTRTHSKELLWQSLPGLLSGTIQRPNVHLLIISLFYCFFIEFSINICIWYSEFTHLQTDLIIKTLQKWMICIGVIVQRPESLLLFVWSCLYPFYFHPLTLFYSGCWLIQMTQSPLTPCSDLSKGSHHIDTGRVKGMRLQLVFTLPSYFGDVEFFESLSFPEPPQLLSPFLLSV